MEDNKTVGCWEFLNSARAAHFDAARYSRRMKELDARCEQITAKMSGMPGGGGSDKHGDELWAALADLRDMWLAKYTEAVKNEKLVEEFIEQIENFEQRAVLKLRYVDRLRWPVVLQDLERFDIYCSDREMFRTHNEALTSAKELWKKTYKESAE